MANKLRLVAENFIDSVFTTFTETPDSGTVNNLQKYSRTNVFTTAAHGVAVNDLQVVDIELPTVQLISAIVLGRHNFPAGLDFQITLYSDTGLTPGKEVFGPTLYTTTSTDAGSDITTWGEFLWGTIEWWEDQLADDFALKPNYVIWLDTPVVAGSMKLEIWVPDYDVEIGRLIVGNYIQPTYTTSYGHTLSWEENTKQFRKGGNTLRSNVGTPARKLTFSLNTITEDDRIILQKAFRHVGLRKDLFISIFPEDTDINKTIQYSGIVKLTKIPSILEYAPMYYNSKYEMEEV